MKDFFRNQLAEPKKAALEVPAPKSSSKKVETSGEKKLAVQYDQKGNVFQVVQVIEQFLHGVKNQIQMHLHSVAVKVKGIQSSPAALQRACQSIIAQVLQSSSQPAISTHSQS
ncbi:MAG: hypothetical protein WCP97_00760 [bacterium]